MIAFLKQFLVCVSVCSLLYAQAPTKIPEENPSTRSKEGTDFDFEGGEIDGKMKLPTGLFIRGRMDDARLKKMVKLKTNFNEKALETRFPVRSMGVLTGP